MLRYEGLISVLLEIISNDFCLCALCVCMFPIRCLYFFLSRLTRFGFKSLKTLKEPLQLMKILICVNKHPFVFVLCSKII